jgi:glycosyltransferase involved in cell wall biosynthesis
VSALGGAVVHVSSPRTWRGGEQQLVYLAEGLRARGVDQRVVCPPGAELARECRARGLPLATAPRRLSVDPWFARAVARAAEDAGAAVVHAHDPHALTASALAASLFGLRAPVVVHRRVDFPIGRGRFSRWKYDHPAVRRIVCVSRAIAGIVEPDVRDPARLRVIHDGVDAARFSGVRPDGRLRRALGVPAGVPLVGNVAALAGHKDYFTFVDTAERLLASGLAARFVAIGDGPLRRELAAYVRARGLEAAVTLAGFRPDVPAVLPELDLLLFTSKEEGLGSSILDAFLCGVPVVATRAGGVPEIVEDGVTGLLAPIRDPAALAAAVRRVLGDPALRARLVAGGARRAAEHSVEAMADATLAVYREAAGEGGG